MEGHNHERKRPTTIFSTTALSRGRCHVESSNDVRADAIVSQAKQGCNTELAGGGANPELLPTRKEEGATVMASPAL
jgi:hypothetical protein